MELRDIEIFLTLAQELHFGRTAARLHLTQARVSQSVMKTERRIGAPLFERTSRQVRLTLLGHQLRDDLAPLYEALNKSIGRAEQAARRATETLALGAMGPQTWMINGVVELFQARHPGVRLRHRDINPVYPFDLLRSGEIDIGLIWLPIREPDLTVGPVTHTSPQVLMVAATHPFADRNSVCREDFGDLMFIAHDSKIPAAMEEVFQPFRTPGGRPIARGPVVTNWDDEVKAVASGQAVIAVPAEVARFYPWPNLVYLPVRDAPPIRWALIWRTAAETSLIRAFAEAATRHVATERSSLE